MHLQVSVHSIFLRAVRAASGRETYINNLITNTHLITDILHSYFTVEGKSLKMAVKINQR